MAQIFGNNSANPLIGTIDPDLLVGFGGNDTLVGGQGADLFDGGSGADTVNYATSFAAVRVDLTGASTGGTAEGDQLLSVENVTGSTFGDRLMGNGQGNVLTGLDGADGGKSVRSR